jgi:hypothetical protein
MNAPIAPGERALWRTIIDAALRAPWADNRPALRFEWQPAERTLEWHTTEPEVWQALPHRRWLALLALGAALENARLRAAERGFDLRHKILDTAASTRVARSSLEGPTGISPQERALESALEARCTNRRFYRREALAAATLQSIASAAGPSLHWLDAPAPRRTALRMLRTAEAERFVQWRLRNELFNSIRFDLGWQKSAAHGLPPAALEVEPPMRAPFASLRHPRVARAAAALGVPRVLAWRAAGLPCALAPHLAIVTSPAESGDSAAKLMAAGRALQRAWLAAAHGGVAVQPFAACGALLRQAPGDGWVRARTQQRLRADSDALWPQLGLDAARDVQIFLRIGKSAPPSVRTGREDVSRVLPPSLRDPLE